MSSYKITYFTTRGRAEAIRLLLTDAGIDFEDVRLTPDEWMKVKESGDFPLKQLPIVEIDCQTEVQSKAILRHLARKYGYNGQSEEEAFRIDVICEALEDLTRPMWDFVFGQFDEEVKVKLKEVWLKTTCPLYVNFLNQKISENSQQSGYFVGENISMADFIFYAFIESVVNMAPGALDQYPKLRANREVVRSRDRIATFLAKHSTSFM
ncbi:S-crystallin SL11-like [Diadema setosum]|uniref:S-crystallin SL11-like n=1 Tax=Diadema setosum TaxID=31175 RepID=UPI003B3BB5EF